MTMRLPFDPKKMAAKNAREQASETPPASRAAGGTQAPLTVSQLAGRIESVLQTGFPERVRVIGQVSGFRERTHWYFDLKDAECVVNCVVFAGAARTVRFTPEVGQEIVLTGRVEFYGKQGRLTLIGESLEPVGAGALELAFRRLVEEIRALGWFAEERKRALPAFPRRVAIVTSRTGAALHDVLDTLRRRSPWIEVLVVDARMQGDGAAAEIANVVRSIGRQSRELAIDVLIVTRGGGSKEELWAFNERILAEAIVQSPIPVIAAIGHETDTTIAELVADLRCATPTQAAMRLAPDREALLEQIDALAMRLRGAIDRTTAQTRHLEHLRRQLRLATLTNLRSELNRVEAMASRLERVKPVAVLERRRASVDRASARLEHAMRAGYAPERVEELARRLQSAGARRIASSNARMNVVSRQLEAVGPASVLARGFSYTTRQDGTLVRHVLDARPGERLQTRVSDGEIHSTVDGLSRSSVQPSRPSKSRPSSQGEGLFPIDPP
jgi:exodeoxyribonuclease VII large subunit